MKRICLSMVAAALVGAGVASVFFVASGGSSGGTVARGIVTSATSSTGGSTKDVASTTPSATQVYERDAAGVVSIKVTDANGGDSGTGIVLNDEGLILTNNHVISEGTSITVSPGKSSSITRIASVVGTDPNSDLALIRVNPSSMGLQPLKLVSSNSVQVGDPVYALGNPYGLTETLTKGIVSALEREISSPDGATIKDVIQTDAPLNPGNSGGPLLNAEGDVIGVNSQIASDAARTEGSQPGSTGVGFAISSNVVSEVIKIIESDAQGTTKGTEGESRSQRPRVESSPYGTESPYQTETPETTEGSRGESRESGPYGYESNGATGVEGTGEVGSSGGESSGVGAAGGEGREGQVVIVP
jgi:putative serine protease PepD